MTSYTTLSDATLSANKPLTQAVTRAMRDNPIAITEGSSGAPKIQTAALEQTGGSQAVTEATVRAAAISQAKIKTTTAASTTSVNNSGGTTISLAGGEYSWWTASSTNGVGSAGVYFGGNSNAAAGVLGVVSTGTINFHLDERYVQASPPYTDGPLFIFGLMNGDGTADAWHVMPDPPWAYHGPTDIRPQYERNGRLFRRCLRIGETPLREAITQREVRNRILAYDAPIPLATEEFRRVLAGELALEEIGTELRAFLIDCLGVDECEVEITEDYKDSDRSVVPHPFTYRDISGKTVVLLEPGTMLMDRLSVILHANIVGGAREVLDDIVNGDYLILGNTECRNARALNGVKVCPARWKLTK